MFIKVCGIKYSDNLKEVALASPDAIGLIFYSGSARNAFPDILPDDLNILPGAILKTGVFVNEKAVNILKRADEYNLDLVQLHGNESPAFCEILSSYGLNIIKAFRVDESFDFSVTQDYSFCRFFLFDTKGKYFGGNGTRFDWSNLQRYAGSTPFLLSGGITPESITDILNLRHRSLAGLDLNSGFETEPGRKDLGSLKEFIDKIRQ